jgi:hypothetical protein
LNAALVLFTNEMEAASIIALVDMDADYFLPYDAAYKPKDKEDFERQFMEAVRAGATDENGHDLGAQEEVNNVTRMLRESEDADIIFFVREKLVPTPMLFFQDVDDYDKKVFKRFMNYRSLCEAMGWAVDDPVKKRAKMEEEDE